MSDYRKLIRTLRTSSGPYAHNRNVRVECLRMARDYRKARCARNPNCPPAVLRLLASDEDAVVRYYVGQNLNCPLDALAALAKDLDQSVRTAAETNPNCPPAAR